MEKIESLKLKADILKTKLLFFSAIAGGSWVNLNLKFDFFNIVVGVAFAYGLIGTLKSLVKLNKIEKEIQ